ncbi:MAG: group II intron maturase-specific domain-containing protein [Bacillota bacterium]
MGVARAGLYPRIVRYADDILVFARTPRQAEKYKKIAHDILEGELKLVVNKEKTHVTSVMEGVAYLGFVIYPKHVSIHPKKIKAFKDTIRELTPRNHGMNVEEMVKRLKPILRGWINYFRIANCKGVLHELMGWIRRRLRMKQMREWKSWRALHKVLRQRGYNGEFEKISMRRWRNSASPLISMALSNTWFDEILPKP